jgi:hypothetical protein
MIQEKHLSLAITLKCNLRCVLCSAASPYYRNPTIYSSEILNRSVDEYFNVVDKVVKFALTGGEPLLNNTLPDVILHLHRHIERIDYLELITNGTLLPSKQLLDSITATQELHVLIDNYGENVSTKSQQLKELLIKKNIVFAERVYYGDDAHCGGWVDFRELSSRKADPKSTFASCAYPNKMGYCHTLVGGKVFPCSATRRCVEQKIIPTDTPDMLDLLDEKLSVTQKRLWFEEMAERTALQACAYCDGLSDTAKRFPAGEQCRNLEQFDYIW